MFETLGWIAEHSWDITVIVLLLFAGIAPIVLCLAHLAGQPTPALRGFNTLAVLLRRVLPERLWKDQRPTNRSALATLALLVILTPICAGLLMTTRAA